MLLSGRRNSFIFFLLVLLFAALIGTVIPRLLSPGLPSIPEAESAGQTEEQTLAAPQPSATPTTSRADAENRRFLTSTPTALPPASSPRAPSTPVPAVAMLTATRTVVPTSLSTATTLTALSSSPVTQEVRAAVQEHTATVIYPTATLEPEAVAGALQQVAEAEAGLRSGQLEVAIRYSSETRSAAQIWFALDDEVAADRIHIVTTYESAAGTQRSEYLAIGEQAWQRQADEEWVPSALQESAWGQLQSFLPHAASVSDAELTNDGDMAVLQWHDSNRDTDVTLYVSAATGIPQEMHHSASESGLERTITYSQWNLPVEITPPIGP